MYFDFQCMLPVLCECCEMHQYIDNVYSNLASFTELMKQVRYLKWAKLVPTALNLRHFATTAYAVSRSILLLYSAFSCHLKHIVLITIL